MDDRFRAASNALYLAALIAAADFDTVGIC